MSDTSDLVPFRARRALNPLEVRNNPDAFDMRLLLWPGDISEALRLRHRAYASQGHVPLVKDAEYRDTHDDYSSTAIFGAYDAGRLVASMRVCFSLPGDGLASLPCAPYYPALATLAANSPNGLIEVSRLAIEPGLGNTSYRATLYGFMVRAALAAARAASVSRIIVATRPDWVATYKHLLSFEQVGEPALYPPGDMPITLLVGNLEDAAKRAWMRNRFFRVSDDDIAHMHQVLAPVLHPVKSAVAGASKR